MLWRQAITRLLHSSAIKRTSNHDLDIIMRRAVLYNHDWQKVSEGFTELSPMQCQQLFETHFDRLNRFSTWTKEDKRLLTRRVMLYGHNWDQVSQGLDKTPEECRDQWTTEAAESQWTLVEMQAFWRGYNTSRDWKIIAQHVPSKTLEECTAFYDQYAYIFGDRQDVLYEGEDGEWTADHTRRLRALIANSESPDWAVISKRFGLTPRQVRQKIVEPSRRPWSKAEKDELTRLIKQHGKKWTVISQHLPGRTARQCSLQYYGKLSRMLTTPFTSAERVALFEALEAAGTDLDWKEIAKKIPGKTASECRKVAESQPATQGPWTEHEDSLLRQAVEMYGEKTWSSTATMVPGRSPLQCRMRWLAMDPSVSTGKFTEHEVLQLITLVGRYGFKWTTIAQELGTGRNGRQLELKFRWLLRKQKYPGDLARKVYRSVKDKSI